jgi:hypothetical protein
MSEREGTDHPSQAEGDVGDDELSGDGSTTDVTDGDGQPVDNPSGG